MGNVFYLEYEESTRLVVKIHDIEPSLIGEGNAVVKSDNHVLELGLELEFIISVGSVDQDGNVLSLTTTKQVEPAYQLLKKLNDSEKQIEALTQAVAELSLLVGGVA